MLTLMLLAATPFSPPVEQALEHCSRAACSSTEDVRVCKCLKPSLEAVDLMVVDGPGERRVLWATNGLSGDVTDFAVQRVDLDGDGAKELLVTSLMSEAENMSIRTWDVTVVDGADELAVHAVAHDVGLDVLKGTSLLLTEWAFSPAKDGQEATVTFVGREFTYDHGALKASKAPVLRRRYTPEFEKQRTQALAQGPLKTLPARTFLAHPSTQKGVDELPSAFKPATLKALTREEPEFELHAESDDGQLVTLSTDGEEGPLLRVGDARTRRLYPLRYWPHEPEALLLGRKALLAVEGGRATGLVFLQ